MSKIITASCYKEEYLQIHKPQPLVDHYIEQVISSVMANNWHEKRFDDSVYENFSYELLSWVKHIPNVSLKGLDNFPYVNIINGCTQFIDNLYMQSKIQTFSNDYRYHQRLNLSKQVYSIEDLIPQIPLIVSMPFPAIGDVLPDMVDLLDYCLHKDIPVHIDSAWITCSNNLYFDFDHPAIQSIGMSLSKGLGLGWNRIGIRLSRDATSDSVTLMNSHNMNNRALVLIGLEFLKKIDPGHLWHKHQANYYKICRDFKLAPTNSIHLALKDGQPVGVSPLLRYLELYEM